MPPPGTPLMITSQPPLRIVTQTPENDLGTAVVNKIRWMIEQVISHFKNWTIVHTDYRRPLKTFETTISAVVGLHFYRTA